MSGIGLLGFIFGASFVVGLSGAMMPGPLLVLDIRESLQRGFWAGLLISSAHALLKLGMVLLWMSWDILRT